MGVYKIFMEENLKLFENKILKILLCDSNKKHEFCTEELIEISKLPKILIENLLNAKNVELNTKIRIFNNYLEIYPNLYINNNLYKEFISHKDFKYFKDVVKEKIINYAVVNNFTEDINKFLKTEKLLTETVLNNYKFNKKYKYNYITDLDYDLLKFLSILFSTKYDNLYANEQINRLKKEFELLTQTNKLSLQHFLAIIQEYEKIINVINIIEKNSINKIEIFQFIKSNIELYLNKKIVSILKDTIENLEENFETEDLYETILHLSLVFEFLLREFLFENKFKHDKNLTDIEKEINMDDFLNIYFIKNSVGIALQDNLFIGNSYRNVFAHSFSNLPNFLKEEYIYDILYDIYLIFKYKSTQ